MIEDAYYYGNALEDSSDSILDLVKNIDGYETTYFIYFNLDSRNIEIESKKFSSEHPKEYLYIDEKKKGHFYSSSCTNIANILGYNEKYNKDKRSIFESLNSIINEIKYKEKDFNEIIQKIEDIFYCKKYINLENNKNKEIVVLKDEYYNKILELDGKNRFFVTGYIYNNKCLLSKLKKYKNLIIKYKFGERNKNQNEKKIIICDFCGKEKEIVNNFGSTNPYKLNVLKMFGSEFVKGFYSINNSENLLYKTLRCCSDCIRKIQRIDCNIDPIGTLRQLSQGKKSKTNPVNIYMFVQNLVFENVKKETINNITDIIKSLFGDKLSFEKLLRKIPDIKDGLLYIIDNIDDIAINLYFNIGSNNKNQVIHEARNLTIHDITQIFIKLRFITDTRKILLPDSERFFNLQYIFEIISLFNYKVSIEVIKSFFYKKVPLRDVVLKGMLNHIRSSIHESYPEKLNFIYHTLTMDISFILSFITLLNKEDFKMQEITQELVLERYEKKEKDKIKILLKARPIKSFVQKIYLDISESEIALMQIGEIICDITNELYKNNKKDREKVFLSKINYSGMSNIDIEKYLVFINEKINQYYMDLKYIKNDLSETLNQITIVINNNKVDKIKSVLRIVDGYNLKNRINKLARILNKENEQ